MQTSTNGTFKYLMDVGFVTVMGALTGDPCTVPEVHVKDEDSETER